MSNGIYYYVSPQRLLYLNSACILSAANTASYDSSSNQLMVYMTENKYLWIFHLKWMFWVHQWEHRICKLKKNSYIAGSLKSLVSV